MKTEPQLYDNLPLVVVEEDQEMELDKSVRTVEMRESPKDSELKT